MNIKFCGYSLHAQKFYMEFKTGVPGYLLRLQTEGTCKVKLNEREFQLEKGDLLLTNPEDMFELIVEDGDNSGDYHLLCEGDWIDAWWRRSEKPSVSTIDLDENIMAIWRCMILEDRRSVSEKNDEILHYLVQTLCLSLERAAMETKSMSSRPYTVTRMMRYIEENAITGIKVEDVAKHAGLSVSRSAHLFKSSVGKTMIEYAHEIKLAVAIDFLKHTTYTLEHIAEDCGFGSYSYFHRVFKKHYGISPGDYRSSTKHKTMTLI
ncbi:AraC family transcriptional regulator [Halalkalibacterium halodurans]|uniref:Transcriptional regulator (AraC/XylS family) n=2 Tax=Halalkalibacterium halodurans TaxID=86665 RepID=Q9KEY8_HALH5|nr:AraC family transcriptional regulator [Halalkalibacterium halodurans]MDY7221202.1 AraC family transcriptional regulator [Halalkalibacterium halodurans]MDY7240441.1 AraC family transcriptional regulator [Halalkalibacterium halodurans]MED3647442.1 AraC family transcriptional regulator [Halalkalibacterium halodurans]MED4080337.1 AraC family transcriptional regulator [Halalkalibacterium halodurans]MED4084599.1 AraC family transcriptional regulator [Halalkalibacterium halodurans]